jgi:hypothetical protein
MRWGSNVLDEAAGPAGRVHGFESVAIDNNGVAAKTAVAFHGLLTPVEQPTAAKDALGK